MNTTPAHATKTMPNQTARAVRNFTFVTIATIAMVIGFGSARAQAFPEKPIRVVLTFTPGGPADLSVRLMQAELEKRLGQPIVIEYKPGAGGKIAMQAVASAQPDGYTLLLGATNNFVIDQFLGPDKSFDPLVELIPLVKVAEVPAVLFASKEMQAKDWATFKVNAAKPGVRLNLGSPGVGTTPHLSSILLASATKLDITHIAYRGAQPAIQALLANDIQLFMGAYGPVAQFVNAGRVTALAVAAQQRLPGMPNIPTTKEAGIPDALANNWFALAAPRNTPQPVVARLVEDISTVLQTTPVRAKYLAQGFVPSGTAGPQLRQELSREATRWRNLVATEKLDSRQ